MITIRARIRAAQQAVAAGRDQGSMSAFLAVLAVGLFLVMGLVVDGGGALNQADRATALAQEAARSAGQQLDPDQAIEGSAIVVDPAAASAAAQDYLAAADANGTVEITDNGQTLTVTVHDTYHSFFASLIGTSSIDVSGTATAHLQTNAGG